MSLGMGRYHRDFKIAAPYCTMPKNNYTSVEINRRMVDINCAMVRNSGAMFENSFRVVENCLLV